MERSGENSFYAPSLACTCICCLCTYNVHVMMHSRTHTCAHTHTHTYIRTCIHTHTYMYTQDYPSVGQIVQMLQQKEVAVIFAIAQARLDTYRVGIRAHVQHTGITS